MNSKELLMMFVRNPELGKVKTRLAASVGPEVALEIYIHLLQNTKKVTQELPVDKVVYYAEKVEEQDMWPASHYQKRVQAEGGDLGKKMQQAFITAFEERYGSVVIIGSDCHQLTQQVIEQAFEKLKAHDVVIGPSLDGGYYLLGMKKLHHALFENKQWSTEHVSADTIQEIEKEHLSYYLLPRLSDVDHIEDVDMDLFA